MSIVNLTSIFETYKINVDTESLQLISSGRSYQVKEQSGCIFMICTSKYTEESSKVEFMMNCMKVGWNDNTIMRYINKEILLSKVDKKIMDDFIMYIKKVNNIRIKNGLRDIYYTTIDKFIYNNTGKYNIMTMVSLITENNITKKGKYSLRKKYGIKSDGTIDKWYSGSNILRIFYIKTLKPLKFLVFSVKLPFYL